MRLWFVYAFVYLILSCNAENSKEEIPEIILNKNLEALYKEAIWVIYSLNITPENEVVYQLNTKYNRQKRKLVLLSSCKVALQNLNYLSDTIRITFSVRNVDNSYIISKSEKHNAFFYELNFLNNNLISGKMDNNFLVDLTDYKADSNKFFIKHIKENRYKINSTLLYEAMNRKVLKK